MSVVNSQLSRMKVAPLSSTQVMQLKRNAENIQATAKALGNVALTPAELEDEQYHAENHFELGCWLHYYKNEIGKEGEIGLQARVDCLKRLIKAGFGNPEFSFYTVFGFGGREFDTIFEMGDGDQVKEAVLGMIESDTSGAIKKFCKQAGWLNNQAKAA